jgi:peptidoglycan-associated lipoprotein
MRRGLKPAVVVLGLTAMVVALSGCSSMSWDSMKESLQFWKRSAATPAPEAPAVATAAPATSAESALAPPVVASAPVPAPMPEPPRSSPSLSNNVGELPEFMDVHFGPAAIVARRGEQKVLDALVRWLKEHPGAVVTLEGHTDELGTREGNLVMGEKRARTIMKYLVAQGIEPTRISITSYGPDRPICTEKTDACRAKNRRVSFFVKQP